MARGGSGAPCCAALDTLALAAFVLAEDEGTTRGLMDRLRALWRKGEWAAGRRGVSRAAGGDREGWRCGTGTCWGRREWREGAVRAVCSCRGAECGLPRPRCAEL